MKIILASKSKRRQELLKMLGINYEIVESTGNELIDNTLTPIENCQNISLEKALDVQKKTNGDRIIIACDTIVCMDNQIYGKPKDYEDAFDMLKILSGRSHEVISCLTVIKVKNKKKIIKQESSTCKVYIDNMSDSEINEWLIKNKLNNYFEEVTNVKPIAYIYLDDRAINFKGNYNKTLEEINNFKVYWDSN